MMSTDTPSFRWHDVQWTPQAVQRFWDCYARRSSTQDRYFGQAFGDALLRFLKPHVDLRGRVADLGCGPGHFLDKLLARGATCLAMDTSVESLAAVRERLDDHPGLLRVERAAVTKMPWAHGELDCAFVLEVLEHLNDSQLAASLSELGRTIRTGGCLVVTVPNEEDLAARSVGCPECGCVFHVTQHVRSFDGELLARLLTEAGFQPVLVKATNLGFRSGPWLRRALRQARRLCAAPRTPHLVAVAKRVAGHDGRLANTPTPMTPQNQARPCAE
jgi:SAM-dependent methyltransferase